MLVPGANLLKLATSVIAQQRFDYHPFVSRVTNEIGLDEAIYGPAVSLRGSVQPVPRRLYQQLGLDFQKSYYNFFLSNDVIDIARDVSGDQFTFNNYRFQALSKTPWHALDGWDQVLCVVVPTPNSSLAYRITVDGSGRITAEGARRIPASLPVPPLQRITASGGQRATPSGAHRIAAS